MFLLFLLGFVVVRGLDVWDDLFLDCYFRCVDRERLRRGFEGCCSLLQ